MAKKLRSADRAKIAEKIMDVGNLVLAALVVGQVLSSNLDIVAAIGGFTAFALTYLLAYLIMKWR